ncbi:hypothetical protein KIN20_028283 [Parelaphostrongylus tenuis]|uniref:Uncharacterized protein n=1 Tax=Parelaphostrongylus tenuis TaxID=148309 RepID=A0AAD5R119_PARTN|nr:hypothetical protein KIN20_028283 [Parelaphostrongylus tenuis]
MDQVPFNFHEKSIWKKLKNRWKIREIIKSVRHIGANDAVELYELMTAPIAKVSLFENGTR